MKKKITSDVFLFMSDLISFKSEVIFSLFIKFINSSGINTYPLFLLPTTTDKTNKYKNNRINLLHIKK